MAYVLLNSSIPKFLYPGIGIQEQMCRLVLTVILLSFTSNAGLFLINVSSKRRFNRTFTEASCISPPRAVSRHRNAELVWRNCLVPLELSHLHTMLVSIAWVQTQLEFLPDKSKSWQYIIFLWFHPEHLKNLPGLSIIQQ